MATQIMGVDINKVYVTQDYPLGKQYTEEGRDYTFVKVASGTYIKKYDKVQITSAYVASKGATTKAIYGISTISVNAITADKYYWLLSDGKASTYVQVGGGVAYTGTAAMGELPLIPATAGIGVITYDISTATVASSTVTTFASGTYNAMVASFNAGMAGAAELAKNKIIAAGNSVLASTDMEESWTAWTMASVAALTAASETADVAITAESTASMDIVVGDIVYDATRLGYMTITAINGISATGLAYGVVASEAAVSGRKLIRRPMVVKSIFK